MEVEIKRMEDTVRVQAQLVALAPELAKGKSFVCKIEPHRKKRSLDANSYFHVLVDKIAKELKAGADEIKVRMNLEYGTPWEIDGEHIVAALPKKAKASDCYKYAKWMGDFTSPKGKQMSQYLLYKETHTLDSSEMVRLIDGVVSEAKGLGIETLTPDQIAQMKSLWGSDK